MTTPVPERRTVLERFPDGPPRGSWPADEFAVAQRAQGTDAPGRDGPRQRLGHAAYEHPAVGRLCD